MFESWEERAWKSCRNQAVSIGSGVALPATARSLTKEEAVGKDGSYAFLLFMCTALFVMIGLALMLRSPGDLESKRGMLFVIGMLSVALFFLAQARARRRSAYVDPEIAVEVAEGGVTVRNADGAHALANHEIDYEFVHYSHSSSVTFMGIKLESPIGAIELVDDCYRDGKKVAAAIATRAEREKVEGGFLRAG